MGELRTKTAFVVLNNPEYVIVYQHDIEGNPIKDDNGKFKELRREPTEFNGLSPQEICDTVVNRWVSDSEGNTAFCAYCISCTGLPHLHMVLESTKVFRANSKMKLLFPKNPHIEPTRGTKKQVDDYVNKRGIHEEKGETVVATSQVGEIRGAQGKRNDLIDVLDLHKLIFEDCMTPKQILKEHPEAYKSYTMLNQMYNNRLDEIVPIKRNVKVVWLVGETETGKSHEYIELCKKYGRDSVYRVANYEHPFDNYVDEKVLVLDEFRDSCFSFSDLLNIIEGYYERVNARYFNHIPQWTEVYITSPLLPYDCYNKALRNFNDKSQQFYRRIDLIVHCSAVVFDNAEGKKTKYCFKREYKPNINGKADDYRKAFEREKIHYLSELQKGNYNPYGLVYSEPIIDEHRYDDVIDIYDEGGSEFGTYSTAV